MYNSQVDWKKTFYIFRLGQFISMLGNGCAKIAFIWWLLDKTSIANTFLIFAISNFLGLAILPLFGILADKHSKKILLIIGDIWRCITWLLIWFISKKIYIFNFNLLLVLIIFSVIGSSLFNAANSPIVAEIVPKDYIDSALRQTRVIEALGNIFGGVFGGIIIAKFGLINGFLVNSLSFLIAALMTIYIKENKKSIFSIGSSKSILNDFINGVKYFINDKSLFFIAITIMLLNLFYAPIELGLTVLIKDISKLPPWFMGVVNSSLGVGAIVGSFLSFIIFRKSNRLFLISCSIIIVGTSVILLPKAFYVIFMLALIINIRSFVSLSELIINTQLQKKIEPKYRGRVFAFIDFMGGIITPLGIAVSGALIQKSNLEYFMFCAGIGIIAVGVSIMYQKNFKVFVSN